MLFTQVSHCDPLASGLAFSEARNDTWWCTEKACLSGKVNERDFSGRTEILKSLMAGIDVRKYVN